MKPVSSLTTAEDITLVNPVSYTHLDVYKRQIHILTSIHLFICLNDKSFSSLCQVPELKKALIKSLYYVIIMLSHRLLGGSKP